MGTGGKTPPVFEDPPQLFFFIIIIYFFCMCIYVLENMAGNYHIYS